MANGSARDVRISEISPLRSPDQLSCQLPLSNEDRDRISQFRENVNNIISGKDNRLLAIVGPCSIHDPKAAIEYAEKLKKLADEISDQFFVVMRTYFEKPRTALGWKGLITDPDMDKSYDIDKGLEVCRKLLLDITHIGLPVGCECLDPIVPQYTDELMSWSSIGARTTESQTHRSLASGLSVAIGFKNSTSGDFTAAINAVRAQSYVKMLEAQAEGNMHKLAYYRWNYQNAEKVVADFGVTLFWQKKKSAEQQLNGFYRVRDDVNPLPIILLSKEE